MTPEITSALRILYGREISLTPVLLQNLDPERIKAIFRKRALELHPDRAVLLGKNPGEMGEAFKDVKLAYERILDLVRPSVEKIAKTNPTASGKKKQTRPKKPGDNYWEAGIPQINLLFGQFLYYSGLITFHHLVSAVAWQRRQRPSFGSIAKMWGYMNERELRSIIYHRARGERIGETALRTGLLSSFQIAAVTGFQNWMQRPIGEYFSSEDILEPERILFLVEMLKTHNLQVRRKKWREMMGFERKEGR